MVVVGSYPAQSLRNSRPLLLPLHRSHPRVKYAKRPRSSLWRTKSNGCKPSNNGLESSTFQPSLIFCPFPFFYLTHPPVDPTDCKLSLNLHRPFALFLSLPEASDLSYNFTPLIFSRRDLRFSLFIPKFQKNA